MELAQSGHSTIPFLSLHTQSHSPICTTKFVKLKTITWVTVPLSLFSCWIETWPLFLKCWHCWVHTTQTHYSVWCDTYLVGLTSPGEALRCLISPRDGECGETSSLILKLPVLHRLTPHPPKLILCACGWGGCSCLTGTRMDHQASQNWFRYRVFESSPWKPLFQPSCINLMGPCFRCH